ncbi:MAG: hypothetical protein JWM12_2458 [Ilumatobacteraceae bacterium]|jgi:hypothetical protein|nr:hypothetical protein [Ilumatobacteraceae bacterium]
MTDMTSPTDTTSVIPTDAVVLHEARIPHRRRRSLPTTSLRVAAAAAAMIPLAIVVPPVEANRAPPVTNCLPLACAADYIGVSTELLATIALLRTPDHVLLGWTTVITILDAAEQSHLASAANTSTPALPAEGARHDQIRDDLYRAAVGTLLPTMATP